MDLFSDTVFLARKYYRSFVKKGIDQGHREDLIGGGLIRSSGGWSSVKTMRKAKIYEKGDERILPKNCIQILKGLNKYNYIKLLAYRVYVLRCTILLSMKIKEIFKICVQI